MRFNTLMNDQFSKMSIYNLPSAKLTVQQLSGAWEVWYQVQFGLYMLAAAGNKTSYEFAREVSFPNNAQSKCDFVISPTVREVGFRYWIELKVLLQLGAQDLVRRFLADVQKLIDASPYLPELSNTAGAVAVAPNGAADFLQLLRVSVGVNANNFWCVVYDQQKVVVRFNLSDGIPAISNDAGVLVYTMVV